MHSMTGYGLGSADGFSVEVRSVNHRFCDVTVRYPRGCSFLQNPVAVLVGKSVSRGKIEVVITRDTRVVSPSLQLNPTAVAFYRSLAAELAPEFADDLTLSRLLSLPEVLTADVAALDEQAILDQVTAAARCAVDAFLAARREEGAALCADIAAKLRAMRDLVDTIRMRLPALNQAYETRLRTRIADLLLVADEARLLTEVAFWAEKTAVDEELVRIDSHFALFDELLDKSGAIGKEMDFLCQEIGREINTIGSKIQDIAVTPAVIALKSELEKIREQVQNIE